MPLKIFIAIHVKNLEQTIRNVSIAFENCADGVFLVNHDDEIEYNELIYIGKKLRELFPYYFIGVNFLDLGIFKAFEILGTTEKTFNAIWTDNAYISDREMFRETIFYKKKSKWNGMYFASFDFKYQKSEKNYKLLENIGNYVDVIVTSGTATGEKTQVEKLLAIYENIGDKKIPICAASGVSIENIEEYKKVPGDVYIICSTYVSLNFYELDANKVKQLIKFRLLS